MARKVSPLLTILVTLLLASLSLQASLQQITLKEFDDKSDTFDNVVVIAVDKSTKKGRKFVSELDTLAEGLIKAFPELTFQRVDNDGKDNPDDILFEKYDLLEFPALMYFRKGIRMTLANTKLSESTAKAFLQSRVAAIPQTLSNMKEIDAVDASDYTVFYASTRPEVINWMEGIAAKYHKYKFIRVNGLKVLADYAAKVKAPIPVGEETIVIARRPQDGHWFAASAEDFNHKGLGRFVRRAVKPFWTFYNTRTVDLLTHSDKFVAFYKFDPEKDTDLIEKLKKTSQLYYDELVFVFVPQESKQGEEFIASLGLPWEESALFVVRKESDKVYTKYRAPNIVAGSITEIEGYVKSVLNDHEPKYYVSESAPSQELFDGVTTLVGSTLDGKVLEDKSVHHLVFYHDASTSGQIPTFQKISKQFDASKIKFYVFDTEKNEHPNVDVIHHGTIVLYNKNSKKLKNLKTFMFDNKLNGKELLQFLKSALKRDEDTAKYLDSMEIREDL